MTIWEPFNELKLSQQIEWQKTAKKLKHLLCQKKHSSENQAVYRTYNGFIGRN